MDQFTDFADSRLIDGCIYCGGFPDTRDHVPSRSLLDAPLPENLPVVGACRKCNNAFSSDEEYFVCLLETVLRGSTDSVQRPLVGRIFRRSPALRAKIQAARQERDGQVIFAIEADRVKVVLLKLARGHAAYELSSVCRGEPTVFSWGPLALLSEEQREFIEDVHVPELYPEIGSRAMQRMVVAQFTCAGLDGTERQNNALLIHDWLEVQKGRYRYIAYEDYSGVQVKIVIDEYLYCYASWGEA
ncbi:hypothetical protein RAS12_26875 [Achromobacter seleniivolatilans]|uniref:HNH endonuclease 5 domain-containing protein n=1 Tax=Achromobacter seleniivolatilans TaxID=3047478 RepID=A0ABY9LZM9_9BURK|nr:hypothetical protein [Achromobacter sp. R39]WMD20191.1 hypothetical protein RAS12_26875 [Achromobacter sp. R39]